ncbi:MAG: NADH:ubiquinone reductase (Na(+)-transporting) subunit A [Desulfurivibrio sp.]|nr:NADH:ubiquinone reductase (Na(+)-transporting) subunit A [Desulfurivibrio sp.]
MSKGLELPLAGAPVQEITAGRPVSHVALVGDDYIGLRPSMAVKEGQRVAAGQELFSDKKNPGVKFTAPVAGEVVAINRGARRRFESLVIRVDGDDAVNFPVAEAGGGVATIGATPGEAAAGAGFDPGKIQQILLDSGLWTALRTRPYGKVASPAGHPASLFVTAIDSRPLAADPALIINQAPADFTLGLRVLQALVNKIFLCAQEGEQLPGERLTGLIPARFAGPHPAGLPSTHIHLLDPVGPGKEVWQLGYQDVLAIGYLFRHGQLSGQRVVALAGPAVNKPRLVRTLPGADLVELTAGELTGQPAGAEPATGGAGGREDGLAGSSTPGPEVANRLLSGSVLDGRRAAGPTRYLGRYHDQVSALADQPGSGLFSWLGPGGDRFSAIPAFLSALTGFKGGDGRLAMTTALWGGKRAVYPLGTYERVMPLDIVATALLKSIAAGNTEKCVELGALELIEEDLALCSYVCPGKNDFGPMLRRVLSKIEEEG